MTVTTSPTIRVLGLILGGLAMPAAAIAAPDDPARITVTGTASVRTAPDLAVILFTVRGEGTSADEALHNLVERRKAVESAIGGFRGGTAATTSESAVQEVRGRECQNYQYQPQLSVGACAVLGYQASLEMELRTGAVKDAATIVGAIGRAGGGNVRIGSFQLADDNAARGRATAAAFAEARAQAEALAAAGHVRLGRLLLAADGSASYRPQNEAAVLAAAAPSAPPPPPPPPPISVTVTPRPIETQARVTISFEITP